MKKGIRTRGCLVIRPLEVAYGGEESERNAAGKELCASVDSLKGTECFTRQELEPWQRRELEQFYQDGNCEPSRNQSNGLLSIVDSLLIAFDNAEGPDSAAYRMAEPKQLRETTRRNTSVNCEGHLLRLALLATSKQLKYASLFINGRVDSYASNTDWIAHPWQVGLNAQLRKAPESKAIRQSLLELLPTHCQYGLLKTQLARYRATDGWAADNASIESPQVANYLSDEHSRNHLAFYNLLDTVQVAFGGTGHPNRLGMVLKQFQHIYLHDNAGVDPVRIEGPVYWPWPHPCKVSRRTCQLPTGW